MNKNTKKPSRKSKSKSLKTGFNWRLAVLFGLLIATIGAYFVFNTKAAAGQCVGNGICTVERFWQGAANAQDTLLTMNPGETPGGWGAEGVVFKALNHQAAGSVPVYRVYNPGASQHLWTINAQERDVAKIWGAVDEGVAFYAFPSQVADTVPVFRLTNAGAKAYTYTTDVAFRDLLINLGWGWADPVVAFYAYMPNYVPAPPNIPCNQQVLQMGSNGECVKALQSKLNLLNAQLPVDGVFSSGTRDKLYTLQNYWKFSRKDGVADASTWTDIEKVIGLAKEKNSYNPPAPTPPATTTAPNNNPAPPKSSSTPKTGIASPSNNKSSVTKEEMDAAFKVWIDQGLIAAPAATPRPGFNNANRESKASGAVINKAATANAAERPAITSVPILIYTPKPVYCYVSANLKTKQIGQVYCIVDNSPANQAAARQKFFNQNK